MIGIVLHPRPQAQNQHNGGYGMFRKLSRTPETPKTLLLSQHDLFLLWNKLQSTILKSGSSVSMLQRPLETKSKQKHPCFPVLPKRAMGRKRKQHPTMEPGNSSKAQLYRM
jgi:hypothetical protein